MPVSPYGFAVKLIEPHTDPIFLASPNAQTQFWAKAGDEVKKLVKRRVLQSVDRFGRVVKPIGASTREHRAKNKNWFTGKGPYSPMGRADPNAPPLAPNRERSRIIVLMRHEIIPGGVWIYWARDPYSGKDWGQILGYHRTGFTAKTYRGPIPVPARDQIGVTVQEVRILQHKLDAWWKANRRKWERDLPTVPIGALPTWKRPDRFRGVTVPAVPMGAIGSNRQGLFGRLGAAVRRAAAGALQGFWQGS